ncbi:hypothetical protein C8Q77DRAFT_119622 [Trametes polyzona]|nr:hypothetical protein C8Q77DRAFT_119622 [Trametes polyzona]
MHQLTSMVTIIRVLLQATYALGVGARDIPRSSTPIRVDAILDLRAWPTSRQECLRIFSGRQRITILTRIIDTRRGSDTIRAGCTCSYVVS